MVFVWAMVRTKHVDQVIKHKYALVLMVRSTNVLRKTSCAIYRAIYATVKRKPEHGRMKDTARPLEEIVREDLGIKSKSEHVLMALQINV